MAYSSWFRRNQKRVYIVMICAMGAWGIGSSAMFLVPQKSVGTIAGDNITRDKLVDFESRWRRILLSSLKGPVLDLVWKQMIYEHEAKNAGLVVTDRDISEGLQELSLQIFGGATNIPGEHLVKVLCGSFNVNQDQLFRTIEEIVHIHKLDYFMKNSIKVTADEAWQRYMLENEKVKIKYAALNAEDFIDSVEVTDNDLEPFYNKYKDDMPDKQTGNIGYKEPEKIMVECIIANYNEMAERVTVTDDEVLEYYEQNKETEFRSVADAADEKPSDGNEADTASFKPFDDVKEQITANLQKQKSRDMANDLISKVDSEIYEHLDKLDRPSFEDIAQKHALTYRVLQSPTKNDAFISKEEAEILMIGTDRFASIAFDREKHDPSSPLEALEGKYVFQVIDRKPPTTPPLEEIYNKVRADVMLDAAYRKAEGMAQICLDKIRTTSFDEGLKLAAAELGIKEPVTGETEFLGRPSVFNNQPQDYIVAMQAYRPNVVAKAFSLKENDVAAAFEGEGKKACYIITLSGKKAASQEEFDKNRARIVEQYTEAKRRYAISKWEKSLVDRSTLDI